jgi:HK97 gp10 family phage protein
MSETVTANAESAIRGIKDLENKIAKKYVKQSGRAGCKVIQAAAVATAPVFTGRTQSAIKVRSAGNKKGVIKFKVGIGKDWFKGETFYSAFVAFGHKIGKRALGDTRKQVAPNDWLTKAYDNTKQEAVDVFRATITQLIEDNT